MATGDILSVTINADGCTATVVIEGLAPGGTYDWGFGDDNNLIDGVIPSVRLTVTSLAFDTDGNLVTTTHYVYGQNVLETYGDAFQGQEDINSGDVAITFGLSKTVFTTDKAGAGNSGTAIFARISGDWYSEGGTGCGAWNADVTANNSTIACPEPLAQWDIYAGTCPADRIESNEITLAVNARHPEGIACVKIDIYGGVEEDGQTITVETPLPREKTGLSVCSYVATFDLSAYTEGETIDARFRVYPNYCSGSATEESGSLDSDDYSLIEEEIKGRNSMTVYYDSDSSETLYAYVNTATGNDGTGTAHADLPTAVSAPYATIGGAINDGANRIKLEDGTHNMVGVSPTRLTATVSRGWVIVEPYNNRLDATVQFELRGSPFQDSYNCERLSFERLNIAKNTKDSNLDGDELNFLRFMDCEFIQNDFAQDNIPICFRSLGTYFVNNGGYFHPADFSLNLYTNTDEYGMASFDGNLFVGDDAASAITIACRFVANYCDGDVQLLDTLANTKACGTDGAIIEGNQWANFDVASIIIKIRRATSLGYAIVNNDLEYTSAPSTPLLWIAADDGDPNQDVNNIWVINTTTSGERCNFGYSDDGSSPPHTRHNWHIKNCLLEEYNCKGSEFTLDANDYGHVPLRSGANIRDNQYRHTKGFHNESTAYGLGGFNGINVRVGANESQPSPYVDDNSKDGDSSGYGDYRPNASAFAYKGVRAGEYQIPYDILGNPRDLVNGDHMGAYAYVSGGVGSRDRNRVVKGARSQGLLGRGLVYDRNA